MSARAKVAAVARGRAAANGSDEVAGAAATARAALATLAAELDGVAELTRGVTPRVLAVARDALTALAAELEARTHEVQEQRHFIERVVDALPVGLYVVDRDYRVQAWNHTRETGLQGIARGEALGRTIFEILHRQSAESLRREFDAVFASGELQQYEVESHVPTGVSRAPRTFRISKIPLRLRGADVTHVITVGEDVTQWKEAESRVAHSEKLAAIGQLAAGVMHEINNPLATIAACAESMALSFEPSPAGSAGAKAPFPAAQHVEYLRVIDSEVRRCKAIVDGLLNFSRARPAERIPVDLNAVVEQTLFLLKHHARFKHLSVRMELSPSSGVTVLGNAEQLVQVLMALLLNAADAVEERQAAVDGRAAGLTDQGTNGRNSRRRAAAGAAEVIVRTGVSNGVDARRSATIEVIDEGVGIARAAMPRVFDPFYTTKPPGRGTGLGLSVCYGIVADHGGRMEVDSEVGRGSTFRVILPEGEPMAGTETAAGRRGP